MAEYLQYADGGGVAAGNASIRLSQYTFSSAGGGQAGGSAALYDHIKVKAIPVTNWGVRGAAIESSLALRGTRKQVIDYTGTISRITVGVDKDGVYDGQLHAYSGATELATLGKKTALTPTCKTESLLTLPAQTPQLPHTPPVPCQAS